VDIVSNTVVSIFGMFFIMIVGLGAAKKGIFNEEGNKRINALLLDVVSPVLIFTSYQTELSTDKIKNLLVVITLAFIFMSTAILISHIVVKKKGEEKNYSVERMAIMYTNSGNIGIPLMLALFGKDGVFLCAGFVTTFNIICWSYGVAMLRGSITRNDIFNIFKGPNMIAIMLGLLAYLTNFRLPQMVMTPLNMIAGMITPLTMLVIGATLAGNTIKDLFSKPRVYYIVAIHNLLVPMVCILIYHLVIKRFVQIDSIVWLVTLIAMSCPVGATAPMFAIRFNKNGYYASTLLSVSTLFSLITIPIMLVINNLF
jgi:predicted permease